MILNTPIHRLDRLAERWGLKHLYIKRDDLTDLYGNKTRHIKYIIKHLNDKKIKHVNLIGNESSNCIRIYATALKRYGFNVHLTLNKRTPNGNTKIIQKIKQTGIGSFDLRFDQLKNIAARGFVEASNELKEQLFDVDYIYLYSYDASWIGLSVGNYLNKIDAVIVAVRNVGGPNGIMGTWGDINYMRSILESICIDYNVLPDDIPKADLREIEGNFPVIVKEALNTEGILLDTVYTGRAMWALKEDINKGKIDPESKILFWHTGGIFQNV